MLREPEFLLFASDAAILALWGAGFWLFAGIALLAEKRRGRRETIEKLDKVGWMPWTTIFMACVIIGGGLLALSLPQVVASAL